MFNFLKKGIKKSPELAERIFEYRTYKPYVNNCPDKEVREICKNCKNVQDTLNKVIEYCGEPDTPKARYYYAIAYAWSRIEYNDLAIKYLELYLNNELFNPVSNIQYHKYEMYRYLGQAYEKKKDLDLALKNYKICLDLMPELQVPYLDIANIYKKKNQLDKSLEVLENSKKTNYYKNEFKKVIDRYIEDYKQKIKNKYIYKPRNK